MRLFLALTECFSQRRGDAVTSMRRSIRIRGPVRKDNLDAGLALAIERSEKDLRGFFERLSVGEQFKCVDAAHEQPVVTRGPRCKFRGPLAQQDERPARFRGSIMRDGQMLLRER